MSILAAFLLPHPPTILPEIGRGEELKISATTEAYRIIAERIAQLKPDTLVLASPHAPYYRDAFFVSQAPHQAGTFANFNAPEVGSGYETDLAFVRELTKDSATFALSNASTLDHGSLVPLTFIHHAYRGFKLVRLGFSALERSAHVELGQRIAQTAKNLNRRIVFIASGDLSHYLGEQSPYGYHPEGPEFDRKTMAILKSGKLEDLLGLPETFCEKAGECGYRSLLIMNGVLSNVSFTSEVLSYEGPFGIGYGCAAFMVKQPDPYVALARKAVEAYVRNHKTLKPDESVPEELRSHQAGVFVSLHRRGLLRGCIGTIAATTGSVAEEILRNAVYACSEDPRFYPVEAAELGDLDISVDVLGPAEAVSGPEFLDIKRYGVIVSRGHRRGLLLPDLEGVNSVAHQISIALAKAGIPEDEDYSLERFEVIRHHDDL